MGDGIRGARILCEGRIIQIKAAAVHIHGDVFQDRAEHASGRKDVGLVLCGESNHFGVATALEVENTLVIPAVLIVTQQRPLGIGRQSGLAGP